jgi:crotonobetainyl-CoA:carnitine CoA-transferase CaiB-like acyl-CoA transferase
MLGQHTDEVLEALLGLDAEEIAALRRESVL